MNQNYTFISTSTPAGSSNFISASTVFGLEFKISINLKKRQEKENEEGIGNIKQGTKVNEKGPLSERAFFILYR